MVALIDREKLLRESLKKKKKWEGEGKQGMKGQSVSNNDIPCHPHLVPPQVQHAELSDCFWFVKPLCRGEHTLGRGAVLKVTYMF